MAGFFEASFFEFSFFDTGASQSLPYYEYVHRPVKRRKTLKEMLEEANAAKEVAPVIPATQVEPEGQNNYDLAPDFDFGGLGELKTQLAVAQEAQRIAANERVLQLLLITIH